MVFVQLLNQILLSIAINQFHRLVALQVRRDTLYMHEQFGHQKIFQLSLTANYQFYYQDYYNPHKTWQVVQYPGK